MRLSRSIVLYALCSPVLLALVGCGDEDELPEQSAEPPPPPEPEWEPPPVLSQVLKQIPDRYRDRAQPELSEEDLKLGASLYTERCVVCHGVNGDGWGPASADSPAAADWEEPGRWEGLQPGERLWITLYGIQGSSMRPLGLQESEAEKIIGYLYSIYY